MLSNIQMLLSLILGHPEMKYFFIKSWNSAELLFKGIREFKGICLQDTAGLCDPECISTTKGISVLPFTTSSRIRIVGQKTISCHSVPGEVYSLGRFSLIPTRTGEGAHILNWEKILTGICKHNIFFPCCHVYLLGKVWQSMVVSCLIVVRVSSFFFSFFLRKRGENK